MSQVRTRRQKPSRKPEPEALMTRVGLALDQIFNGTDDQPRTGFVLMVYPLEASEEARCRYISNNHDRRHVVTLFRQQIDEFNDAGDESDP